MNKIIKCNLGVQYVAEDADAKNIYVTIIYYDDCLKRREKSATYLYEYNAAAFKLGSMSSGGRMLYGGRFL